MFQEILSKIYFISPLFYKVLYMTIVGSLVGIIVYFIRNLFDKKISGKWKCIMWCIVLLALVLPIRFEIKTNKLTMQNTVVDKIEEIKYIPSTLVETNEFNDSSNVEENENLDIQKEESNDFIEKQDIAETQENIDKGYAKINLKNIVLNYILPGIWFVGVIAFILTFLSGIRKISKKNSRREYRDERLSSILEKCKADLEIKRKIKIILQDYKKIPSIFGIFNPVILIKKDLLNESDETIQYIFLHELSHYKRKDILFNFCLLLVLSIHWFNPIVWFLFKKIRQDMEIGADELASKKLNKEEKKQYGMVLINLLRNSMQENYTASMLCMSDTGKNMERRILMIKGKTKSIVLSVLVVVIVFGIIAGFVFVKTSNTSQNADVLENNSEENQEQNEEVTNEETVNQTKVIEESSNENNNSKTQNNKITKVGNLSLNLTGCEFFSEGLAWVADDNNNGLYIDKEGNRIIEGNNGAIGTTFRNGLARAVKDIGNNSNHIYKYGFINKNGEIAIDFIYDDAFDFLDGLAPVEKDGKAGFIDTKGNWVLDAPEEKIPNYFSEGLCGTFKNNKYGFIDKQGNTVIDFIYNTGSMFHEGLAWVEKDGKYYYIDKEGNIVIDISTIPGIETGKSEESYPNVFSDGLALIRRNGKYAYIDKTGNVVLESPYSKAGSFSEGFAWSYKDGKYGFIDKQGNVAVDFEYDSIQSDFSEGLAGVEKNGKCGYVNYDGTVIIGNLK